VKLAAQHRKRQTNAARGARLAAAAADGGNVQRNISA